MTLTQGYGCGIDKQKFACLHNKVRTTHSITTKRVSYAPLVMLISYYLIRLWINSFGNFYFGEFSLKILDVIF